MKSGNVKGIFGKNREKIGRARKAIGWEK